MGGGGGRGAWGVILYNYKKSGGLMPAVCYVKKNAHFL